MCLAVPARVTELLPENMAKIDLGGIEQDVSLDLVDGVGVNDYVLVHVGYALQKLDEKEAQETLEIIAEAIRLAGSRTLRVSTSSNRPSPT
jgi:hydrogenase expression/formation protein HypC